MSTLLDLVEEDPTEILGYVTPQEFLSTFRAERPRVVAFDTESPHYKWMLPENAPFALTFSWGKERTFYLDCARENAAPAAAVLAEVLAMTPTLIAHNTKYDLHVAKRLLDSNGFPLIVRQIHDTMLLDAVCDEQRYHGLKELCEEFGITFTEGVATDLKNEIAEWRAAQKEHTGVEPGFDEVPKRLMVPYAIQDAFLTYELFAYLQTDMDEQLDKGDSRAFRDLPDIYQTELSFLWVAFQAEERGMRIDLDFVGEQMAALADSVMAMGARLNEALPFEMNPGSTDDVARALVHFGHADVLWTNPKTGKVNLPEWRLKQLADDPAAGDLVKSVLEYRTSSKMLNSYYDVLAREHIMDEKGQAIVRCNIKTIGARTGRTSVTEPALQTIPREKGEVRGAFIAREGCKLLFADYQGQELRLLGHYLDKVGDRSIKEVYEQDDADLHMETACAIFEKTPDQVSKGERQDAKNTNFAIVYGAGAEKVGTMHGFVGDAARSHGRIVLNRIYRRFPGLPKLKKACEGAMSGRGYVVTVFGRRHREKNGKYAYKAINSLVQGSGADLAKAAAVKVDAAFRAAGLAAMILLIIHDELLVEAPDEEVDQARDIMRREMTDFPEVMVPLAVDTNVAERWSDK